MAVGEVLTTVIVLARVQSAKAGPTLGTVKTRFYPTVLEALRSAQR